MQDRYAGDLGDFSKFGVLKILAGVGTSKRLRIGLVWYLTQPRPDELEREDGRHISYLEPGSPASRNFRECDPGLYDALRSVVHDRSVASLERAGVLPTDTLYSGEILNYPDGFRFREPRLKWRNGWVDRALARTAGADLVCLDPDNGLECASSPRHTAKAPKFAYLEEIVRWAERGQDLVVYQHANRLKPVAHQVEGRVRELSERLSRPVHAVLFRRGSVRTYLVAPVRKHSALLRHRIEGLTSGPWSDHVQVMYA